MIIGIVGPTCSGKHTMAHYLIKTHNFTHISLSKSEFKKSEITYFDSATALLEFVMMNWTTHYVLTGLQDARDWQVLRKRPFFLLIAIESPMSLCFERYQDQNQSQSQHPMTLNEFVRKEDMAMFGNFNSNQNDHSLEKQALLTKGGLVGLQSPCLYSIMSLADLHIVNVSSNVSHFYEFLSKIDLLNNERLRPSWDLYFMRICDLAASRSNCTFLNSY